MPKLAQLEHLEQCAVCDQRSANNELALEIIKTFLRMSQDSIKGNIRNSKNAFQDSKNDSLDSIKILPNLRRSSCSKSAFQDSKNDS